MRRILTLSCAAACLALAACSTTGTSPSGMVPARASTADCEQALIARLRTRMATPGATGRGPAACAGISDTELERLTSQAMTEVFATPSP
jgi:hypothetical protein